MLSKHMIIGTYGGNSSLVHKGLVCKTRASAFS